MGLIKRIALRSPCTSINEVVERYHSNIHKGLFVLPKPNLFPAGTRIQLEVHLKGGKLALAGRAIVQGPIEGVEGTPIKFVELDDASRGVFRRMLERAAKPEMATGECINRQALSQIFQQMQLVEERFEEPVKVEAGKRSPKGIVLGIDLGTTNSCCAIVKNGKPFVIPSRRGHRTIPSVVAIDPMGQVIVGHAAKAQMEINPARTVYGSKRLVGRPFESPIVRQVRDRFHYEIVAGSDGRAAVKIEDKVMSLERVSSLILTEI
ncbi:MAG: hypothetical protein D6806_10495, partial [Deltaproteobacteria bacterium]